MEQIKCPKCGSDQLSANKKGFGLGKAIIGGVALGPAGVLGGFVGSRKVLVSCIACGHSWVAGEKKKGMAYAIRSQNDTVDRQEPKKIGCLQWLLMFAPVAGFLLYQAYKAGCF